jgi:ATP-dependent Clp protease protease subunit
MIHQPGGGAGGPATDLASQAKERLSTRERLARGSAKETEPPHKQGLADMERDFWMRAEEARECSGSRVDGPRD